MRHLGRFHSSPLYSVADEFGFVTPRPGYRLPKLLSDTYPMEYILDAFEIDDDAGSITVWFCSSYDPYALHSSDTKRSHPKLKWVPCVATIRR